ncbi:hypothetical protein Taro_012784 [Colocasia esculenta]|uniref:Uncharacterized protein n=1 Tax=Colocasia esculenta TaxID=4460 RepID=A0A843UA43_COLES|nr:hypothetical protein [Colocasia esculenta]
MYHDLMWINGKKRFNNGQPWSGSGQAKQIGRIREKLKSLKSAQPPSDDSTPHQVAARNDTYTQVLGPDRLGHVSGVGTGPTPTSM